MKLEWMGRYRELIRMLIKYNNLSYRINSEKFIENSRIKLTAQQWQTLECIIEFEDANLNMNFLAKQLGFPKSSFSKNVKLLVEKGYIARYQQSDNRKNIVLKPTKEGLDFYRKCSNIILNEGWKDAFKLLDSVKDEDLDIFTHFMEMLANELEPENNKVIKLLKLT